MNDGARSRVRGEVEEGRGYTPLGDPPAGPDDEAPVRVRSAVALAWPSRRRRLALLAVVSAIATSTFLAVLGGALSPPHVVYLVVTVLALFFPPLIAVQVIGGQLLVAALFIAGFGAFPLAPAVAGVIVTAELLATVARLDTPLAPSAEGALSRTGLAAAIGGGGFAVVGVMGALPGPTGLAAVAVASGACVLLGTRLAGGEG